MSHFPSPVIVFAYNRPDHLARCLTALSEATLANKTDVWVFSDGARNDRDKAEVVKVRELVNDKKWTTLFRNFRVVDAIENMGLARSIILGVTDILSKYTSAIVLEDDLVVARDFLEFMNDCLVFFAQEKSIGSITGYCPLAVLPEGYEYDVMAVPRICSHGWATWADRWSEVDWKARDAARIWQDSALRKRFNSTGSDQLYRLRRQLSGRLQTWAIIFHLWLILTDRLTIYPVQNRVKNIGFDGSGVHTRPVDKFHTTIRPNSVPYQLNLPDVSPEIVTAFHRAYSGALLGQVKRAFINIRPPSVLFDSQGS